jgi:hypothetical protein
MRQCYGGFACCQTLGNDERNKWEVYNKNGNVNLNSKLNNILFWIIDCRTREILQNLYSLRPIKDVLNLSNFKISFMAWRDYEISLI